VDDCFCRASARARRVENRNVAIEYRWSEGRTERYAEIAAEFVRLKVDVIVTVGSAVPTVRQVTSVIPVVFACQSIRSAIERTGFENFFIGTSLIGIFVALLAWSSGAITRRWSQRADCCTCSAFGARWGCAH
jgi:hypothetical protein